MNEDSFACVKVSLSCASDSSSRVKDPFHALGIPLHVSRIFFPFHVLGIPFRARSLGKVLRNVVLFCGSIRFYQNGYMS